MQSVTIEKNQAGQRLDKFLRKYLPEAGSGFLYKMLRKKNITLNGKKAEGKEILTIGDTVCFFFSDETFSKFTGKSEQKSIITECEEAYHKLNEIRVLFEDDNVVVVNKPAGVLTQKADSGDLSLNEWLIGYLLETKAIKEAELQSFHPSVCNRLDRNTSGIVLCGKSLEGSQALSRIIKDRSIRKFYRTICVGELSHDEILEGFLTKNETTNKVTITQEEPSNQKDKNSYIKTAYHPLCSNSKYTLLEVELITGKPHQIRAHLASIGHPIIGDYKYGISVINHHLQQEFSLKAQLLHAYRIEFPADDTLSVDLSGKIIAAPYPELFHKLINDLQLTENI